MGDFWWEGYYLIQRLSMRLLAQIRRSPRVPKRNVCVYTFGGPDARPPRFTAWILLAQAIYFALAVFTTWKAQRTTQPVRSNDAELVGSTAKRIQRSEKVALPWFARLCVALMHLCVPGSLLVALGYWATFPAHESHAAIVYTTAFAHGISAVLALADLLLGGCAFALRYFFFLVVYMILFTSWSILHHVAKIGRLQGCRNYERHACPIYPMLDWHEPVTTAVSCLVAVVALPLLMSLLVWAVALPFRTAPSG
ncbi:rost [Symbiodinium natans]|uniref:Rost protein n=1 Tax=Symbiodinium natans TaxID=878477 RepID=A0A812MAG6_9DINO|nr:rost [Symbiodinium natans]